MPMPRSASKSRTAAWLAASATLALLAFPGVASAAVTSTTTGGVLTVTSTRPTGSRSPAPVRAR